MRTSKIGNEQLVLNDGENVLCLGKCVLSSISLSVSEMKTFFSQMRVFFLYYYLGSVNLFGGNSL